jgi:ArsR family transcriptional regulator
MSAPLRPRRLERGQFERIAKALADPRRFSVLEAIANAEDCPCRRLCAEFPVTKATISHHVKELALAGLIAEEREGQYKRYRVCREVLDAYTAELRRRLAHRHRSVRSRVTSV